jgi:hypothetical protein
MRVPFAFMDTTGLPEAIATLVNHIASLPHVIAVTSRDPVASAINATARDWSLGVYYRGAFDPEDLRHLQGSVTAPGDRGQIMDGGASLIVDGHRVDLHYREIDHVRHWIQESEAGRFEVESSIESVAGVPSYTLAAEMALGTVVAGSLGDAIEYPERLAAEGAAHWRRSANSSLDHAGTRAEHGDVAGVLAHLAKACIEAAHARLCEARRWSVNEKEILERAELTHLNQLLTALNTDPVTLSQRVMQARTLLLD